LLSAIVFAASKNVSDRSTSWSAAATLQVDFSREGDRFQNVTLSGPADFVFDGTIDL
jgi:hypothetical protein